MADEKIRGFNRQSSIIKVRTNDYTFQRQVEPTTSAINRVSENPLLSSRPSSVEFCVNSGATSPTRPVSVKHSLGRDYRGWLITCVTRGDVRVFEDPNQANKGNELLLNVALDSPVAGPDPDIFNVEVLVF